MLMLNTVISVCNVKLFTINKTGGRFPSSYASATWTLNNNTTARCNTVKNFGIEEEESLENGLILLILYRKKYKYKYKYK